MKVNREELLKCLVSMSPGLSSRELIEQSSCIVCTEDGRLMTFNDEVCVSRQSPIPMKGAVKAKPLLELLSKLQEDEVDVEQEGPELRIKGKGRRAVIKMEQSVLLPVDAVDVPDIWFPLPTDFLEAVHHVAPCASTEESKFVWTCVHIASDRVEASDRFQIARFDVNTGFDSDTLIRAESLQRILGFDMSECCETRSWVHFRNSEGLVISVRKYEEQYPDVTKHVSVADTQPITLPAEIEDAVARADIFSSDADSTKNSLVHVEITEDLMLLRGIGIIGKYEEKKKIAYSGPDIKFLMPASLLLSLSKKAKDCRVSKDKFYLESGKFRYVSSTMSKPPAPATSAKKED